MDFKKVLIETSERRVRKAPSISALSLLKKWSVIPFSIFLLSNMLKGGASWVLITLV